MWVKAELVRKGLEYGITLDLQELGAKYFVLREDGHLGEKSIHGVCLRQAHDEAQRLAQQFNRKAGAKSKRGDDGSWLAAPFIVRRGSQLAYEQLVAIAIDCVRDTAATAEQGDLPAAVHLVAAENIVQVVADGAKAKTEVPTDTEPGVTYTPSEVRNLVGVSDTTLNHYAKKAGVPTPGHGKRNHRYTAEEAEKIVGEMAKSTSEGAMKKKALEALEKLRKPNLNPAETHKANGNPTAA